MSTPLTPGAAKKSLGQHFLIDENLLGVIGRLAELDPDELRIDDRYDRTVDFEVRAGDRVLRRREVGFDVAELQFELAARLRDDLGALHKALEKQAVVFGDGTDAAELGAAGDFVRTSGPGSEFMLDRK